MVTTVRCPVCGPLGTMGLLRLEGPMQAVPYSAPHWGGVESYRLVPVGSVDCDGCNGTGFVVKDPDPQPGDTAAWVESEIERGRRLLAEHPRMKTIVEEYLAGHPEALDPYLTEAFGLTPRASGGPTDGE